MPLMRDSPSETEALVVSILGNSATSSLRKKLDAASLLKVSSNTKSYSSSPQNESEIFGDGRGNGHSGDSSARLAIHSPKPHYPLASRRLREQGLVIVRLCINEQGTVDQTDIARSSGFEGLDHSALKALALWRFAPMKSSAISVSSQCFQTPVQFTLEG